MTPDIPSPILVTEFLGSTLFKTTMSALRGLYLDYNMREVNYSRV